MIRYLEKWLEQSEVQTLEDMKNIIGLEQFFSVLPGEMRYLVKDKKPKNILKASEIADHITAIKHPEDSEVKIGGKAWDDRKKEPREYLKDQQAIGNHFRGKPPEQSQQRYKNWEGKGDKSPSFEQKVSRSCFGCGRTMTLHSSMC